MTKHFGLFRSARSPFRSTHQRAVRRTARSQWRPHVAAEVLEDRTLLAAFTVTTAADLVDANDGVTSLREAVASANTNMGDDTIGFDADLAGQTITLTMGQLTLTDVTGTTTITGLGADQLTVSGNNASRVFLVEDGVTAAISGLTVSDGNEDDSEGGGIRNDGTLTISNCTLSGNSTNVTVGGGSTVGGGIFNSGTLTITHSILGDNSAFVSTVSGSAMGGGIANGNGGMLTITDSTLSNNSAIDAGGIYNYGGTLEISNSTLSGNSAVFSGGGILNSLDGTLTVSDSTLSGNSANGGGGIGNGGTLTITGSTLSGNSAVGGGGIGNGPTGTLEITGSILSGNSANQGGGIRNLGTLTIMDTTISGNAASGDGGGIFNSGGTLTITSSTFSNNSAIGVVVPSFGGGILNFGTVTITGSTFNGNSSDSGGGIANSSSATVTITSSTFSGNTATTAFGSGGGIFSQGMLTITGSTLSGNSADNEGGGICNSIGGTLTITDSTLSSNSSNRSRGGGISNAPMSTVTITNSTLSGNSADTNGGGIFNQGALTITASTFSGNAAKSDGGGIFNRFGSTLTLNNTIVVNSLSANDLANAGDLTGSHNLIEDGDTTGLTDTITGIDPLLGSLQDNGGPTFTHALLAGSPAIDAGDNALAVDPDGNPLTTDQRGDGFVRIAGDSVDIGAFEVQVQGLIVDTLEDVVDGDLSRGDVSLREAVLLANDTPGTDTIRFDPDLDGQPLLLEQGQLEITETVTIRGNGAAATIIDAQQNSRIFFIASTAGDVTLEGLTLQNGYTTQSGGAIRFDSAGTLTITGSTLSGNSASLHGLWGASGGGGAIFSSSGNVTVTDSTLRGNSTSIVSVLLGVSGGGGAIFSGGGDVSVTNSTLSGNSASLGGLVTFVGGGGGAIFSDGGTVSVTNSTLSGNSASSGGVVTIGNVGGGAVFSNDGSVAITSSTIVHNTVQNGRGGGLCIRGGTLTVHNSIVALNTDNGTAPDLLFDAAFSIRHSLIGDNTGTPLAEAPVGSPDANGNLIGDPDGAGTIDPLLGPLQDNGGPTFTHALLEGSPAIDAGDDDLTAGLQFDQRGDGFPRIVGDAVDIGAFEMQSSVTPTALRDFDGDERSDLAAGERWRVGTSDRTALLEDMLWADWDPADD